MKVCVVLTARASYAKLKTVIAALLARDADVQLVACASALLERYGRVVTTVRADFPTLPLEEIYTVHEGATLETSAIETGSLFSALARTYARLKPDVVVVCADRHEILAAAAAAKYQHIVVAHMQGGEQSGSVDDTVRDAVTQLSDWHLVCTQRAQMRVYALTGAIDRVILTGCPSIDVAKQALTEPPVTFEEVGGVYEDNGYLLKDFSQPFHLIMFHPVTDQADQAAQQMRTVLSCATRVHLPRIVFWPGQDAGQDEMAKVLRTWTKDTDVRLGDKLSWHLIRNLPPNRFLRLLSQAAVLSGNSSAGIREASYLGTPVVNIGTRQHGRERGPNVMDCESLNHRQIISAMQAQAAHGKYPSSKLYGNGRAGERIAEVICERVSNNSGQNRLERRAQ